MYPPLSKDHQVLGKEYCSGYTDSFGKWNTGFYCPPESPDSPIVYCCGSPETKYCCTGVNMTVPTTNTYNPRPSYVEMETEIEITNDYVPVGPTIDIGRNSYIAAVIGGLVTVAVVMTLVSCFYCSCCVLYKKRRVQLPGGLYRIPASSTTCGLINSGNGPPTPASSLVTTPLNPGLFTATNWTSTSTNPLQGQLLRTNPPPRLPPQPPPTRVNPTTPSVMHGGSYMISASPSASSNLVPNQDRLVIGTSPTSNCITNGPPRHPTIPSTISSQLQRHLSLLQQHNPSLLRSICLATNGNNGGMLHRSRTHCDTLPTIYTTGSRPHGGGGATGTMNSLISSVTSSSTSHNSLPPPYFLEQYRIRNRVRQPRNVSPAVLLPSYNEIQREQRRDETCLARSGPRGDSRTTSTMNDLSAPPRRHNTNHERVGRSRVNNNNNYHEPSPTSPDTTMSSFTSPTTTTVNLPILNSTLPNPKRIESNSISEEEPSRDKILNTSAQRTSSDSARDRRPSKASGLREINEAKRVTTTSFSPPLNHRHARVVKSHSVGNVTRDRDPYDS